LFHQGTQIAFEAIAIQIKQLSELGPEQFWVMAKGTNLHPHIIVGLEHPIEKGLPGATALLVRFKQHLPLLLVGLIQGLVLLCHTIQLLQKCFEAMPLLEPLPHQPRVRQPALSQLRLKLLRSPFHSFGSAAPSLDAWMLRLISALAPDGSGQVLQLRLCSNERSIDLLPPGHCITVAIRIEQLRGPVIQRQLAGELLQRGWEVLQVLTSAIEFSALPHGSLLISQHSAGIQLSQIVEFAPQLAELPFPFRPLGKTPFQLPKTGALAEVGAPKLLDAPTLGRQASPLIDQLQKGVAALIRQSGDLPLGEQLNREAFRRDRLAGGMLPLAAGAQLFHTALGVIRLPTQAVGYPIALQLQTNHSVLA
jgi:hypothetical protein